MKLELSLLERAPEEDIAVVANSVDPCGFPDVAAPLIHVLDFRLFVLWIHDLGTISPLSTANVFNGKRAHPYSLIFATSKHISTESSLTACCERYGRSPTPSNGSSGSAGLTRE